MQIFVYITAFLFPVLFGYMNSKTKVLDSNKWLIAFIVLIGTTGLAMLQSVELIILYWAYFWITYDMVYVYNRGMVGVAYRGMYVYKCCFLVIGIIFYLVWNI